MTFPGSLIVLLVFSSSTFAAMNLGTREVLLDNEQVQVVRLTYPVGTESGMHTHEYPFRTAYFIKGGEMELIPEDPGEQANVLSVPDGKVIYLPGGTHNVRNIGDTEVIIVETELK